MTYLIAAIIVVLGIALIVWGEDVDRWPQDERGGRVR